MEMWIREKIFNFANIIMRVPPIFVIDELLRIGFGLAEESVVYNNTELGFKMVETNSALDSIVSMTINLDFSAHSWTGMQSILSPYLVYLYQTYLMTALKFLACCLGCIAAICTFMLWTKHLIIVYLYLISVGIVYVSYWSNTRITDTITMYLNSKENGSTVLNELFKLQFTKLLSNWPDLVIIQNRGLQYVLAQLFCYIRFGQQYTMLQFIVTLGFIFSESSFRFIPLGICAFQLFYNRHNIWKTVYSGYQFGQIFISNYGLSAFAEMQWTRLRVPSVLRTFWILRVTEQVIQIMNSNNDEEHLNYYVIIKTLMINGCETLTAVLGMTSIISFICHYIGSFFQWILLLDNEDEKNIGTVSAMLFYILALQTGLTSLNKEIRLLRLCRNLCLLFTAVLHFIHNIVNPRLMSLSASHNPAFHKHVRALIVCVFLIVFPVWLLTFLWSHYTISTWLLAVTVFSIEVVIKVLVSLAIYSLFLYDAYCKNFWDELDDWVYIIRSFGNTIEFGFSVILFFNGFWILVFEAGGTIRALMMCVHAYFNLWCEAKAGWSVFIKRRHAINKINSLPEANKVQLREHADVCAICYQEMESAKITKCNHFFHGICLRKWLYMQDRCPLCHAIMYKIDQKNTENSYDD
ncbi:PREDICTED: protein TRC8 homolog [Ceratosolen solmsi marchali]|uniref:Protein TRC8 homolog n=1 Tax=Ceratosolen solmsi marchali TaxID=326594 RepID=A0AAJ6YFG0_9HYME|nr:PREDICTED: protein TRC8 homolog [Ceratosolen solmsi marchali]